MWRQQPVAVPLAALLVLPSSSSSDLLVAPRKSIGIAMLPTPRLMAPLTRPAPADPAACSDVDSDSSASDTSRETPSGCTTRRVRAHSRVDHSLSHCPHFLTLSFARSHQLRVDSENVVGVEVVPIETLRLQSVALPAVAHDTIRCAEAATGSASKYIDAVSTTDTTKSLPPPSLSLDHSDSLRAPDAPSSASTSHSAVEPPALSAAVVGAPAVWSPSELFASIASDTFFNFLEAFHLQLSPTAADCASTELPSDVHGVVPARESAATVIPINWYVDAHGKTLLHHACRTGRLHVAQSLLFHGIDALAQCRIGRTAFHDAMACGTSATTLALVQLLHAHEPRGMSVVDSNGSHILHLAAIHGCLDVIQWYAALLTEVVVGTPLSALVPMSITSFSGRNLLHYAAFNGRLRVLEWVLAPDNPWHAEFAASALDSSGYSLLHYAAMGGHLDVCKWLVFDAPTRQDLHILAKNSEGQTAFDLAKTPDVKHFVAQVAQLSPAPVNVRCIGADASSLGVAWDVESPTDARLRDVLAPLWFEIEYCKKPKGLTSSSGLLSMVLLLPGNSQPSFLLKWERLSVRMDAGACEYWLAGLERDTEYLVRLRAVNRNGSSAYSTPNVSVSEFTTTTSVGSGLRRILSLFPRSSSAATGSATGSTASLPPSFIGTLHMELLEARHLHVASQRSSFPIEPPRSTGAAVVADHGQFYSIVTMTVPETAATPSSSVLPLTAYRRRTVPLIARTRVESARTKTLYRIRTDAAHVQDEMVLSGSRHAFQHPAFSVTTALRVPEASDAVLTIEIRHKTHSGDASVGVATLSLMDFVRGLPAKLQWLALEAPKVSSTGAAPTLAEASQALLRGSRADDVDSVAAVRGEILIRTLFLADGITALPHPTRHDVVSSSAQELLDDHDDASATCRSSLDDDDDSGLHRLSVSPTSTSSTSSSTSYCSSNASLAFDAMGFRVFDPRTLGTNARGSDAPQRVLSKSYAYYRLLHECIDRRQSQRWQAYHEKCHAHGSGQRSIAGTVHSSGSNKRQSSRRSASGRTDTRGACRCLASPTSESRVSCCPYTERSSPALRLLVWQGVPASWRPAIYMRMSGALQLRAAYPIGYFQSLLAQTAAGDARIRTAPPLSSSEGPDAMASDSAASLTRASGFEAAEKQIQVDLQRTFAADQCWINSSTGQQALARVLLAYAVHNQSLGYCQSMTFVVGRLLCLFEYHARSPSTRSSSDTSDIEEHVFWLLAVFCEQVFPSYYAKGMAGLQVDGLVLESLLRVRLPKVYRHLQQLQTPHIGLLLVTQWLLPICCAVFPSETSFRMLDVLVLDGSRAVFALAIALLRISQHDVLAETKDYMQLFRFLKDRDRRLYDASLLLEIARDEHAAIEHEIDALRRECALERDTQA